MSSRTSTRPSPAILVAAIALVLALAGSAVAGTETLSNKVTKAKVKSIAKKQIAKAAPGLSVSHATGADTAANANHAASADNSGTVGGFAAGTLIRTAGTSTVNAPDTNGTATTTTIQAPGPGFLTIFATADFGYGAADDQVECLLQIDEATLPATSRVTNVSGTAAVDSDCATNATQPVAAGSRKVDLEIAQLDDASVGAAGLSVIFTPFNSSGGAG